MELRIGSSYHRPRFLWERIASLVIMAQSRPGSRCSVSQKHGKRLGAPGTGVLHVVAHPFAYKETGIWSDPPTF